ESGKIEWHGAVVKPFIAGKAPVMCLVRGCRPLLGASLVRREAFFKSGGFDEALRFWECEAACVRVASVGRFAPTLFDEPEYLWRLERDTLYIGGVGARYKSAGVGLSWIEQVLKATNRRPIAGLGLPKSDHELLMKECTSWGRLLYVDDRSAF